MPGIAIQATVTVHRSAGPLSPGVALAVLFGTPSPRPDGGVPSEFPQRRVTFVPITGLTFLVT